MRTNNYHVFCINQITYTVTFAIDYCLMQRVNSKSYSKMQTYVFTLYKTDYNNIFPKEIGAYEIFADHSIEYIQKHYTEWLTEVLEKDLKILDK